MELTKEELEALNSDGIMFVRGFWDGVSFAYIPDFENKQEQICWLAGVTYAKRGGDYHTLCASIT